MTKRKILFACFIAVCAVQLAVPVSMIVKREVTLRSGSVYKFKTRPVDPYDTFRGRYVALGFERDYVEADKYRDFYRGEEVYAVLDKDGEGFAYFSGIQRNRPAEDNYIKARIRTHHVHAEKTYIDLPFDRYYMEEGAAPAAERAYRENSTERKHDAYVKVKVRSGFAVIEELYIEDKPIMEYLEQSKNGGTKK